LAFTPTVLLELLAHRTVTLGLTFQAKLTAIAVNLKRTAALVGDKWGDNPAPFAQFAVFQTALKFIFNFKTSKTLLST